MVQDVPLSRSVRISYTAGALKVLISFFSIFQVPVFFIGLHGLYKGSPIPFSGPNHPLTLPSSRLQGDLRPPHNLRRLNSHHDTPMHPLLPPGSQSRFWSCRHARRRIINYRTTYPLVIKLRSIFPYTPHNGGRHGVSRFGIGQSWYKGGEVGVTVIFYLYPSYLNYAIDVLQFSTLLFVSPIASKKAHSKQEKVSWSCQ